MTDPATSRPRIDRQFVDQEGRLTMGAYALLSKLFDTPGSIEELAGILQYATNEAEARSRSDVQELARAIDDVRNELAYARGEMLVSRSQLDELSAQMAGLRSVADLRNRVEQIEGRLQ